MALPVKMLNQYRGFLTNEQIAAGIRAATQNAARLAEDAEMLLTAGRYPSACSLAILSLEEFGKTPVLRSMATATTQKDVLDLWKSYRRHLDKHLFTLMPGRVAKGARLLSDFQSCVTDATLEEKATYDAIKQIGFYTDCLGNAHWSLPCDVVDKELACSLVANAKVMSSESHSVTTREIELWTMHMQGGITRRNLIAWAAAMEAENLHPEGYIEKIANFTKGL